ncbi:glutamate-ammonia-ligase adenylyltransferase [Thiohalorhabdus denitrificans]|uniref:Bifunctional glutamine synthetase adenylyltransferase/adenylyl-removing enzyme n=2 Tax=Thiohalorhabdus denitrificans TaxID=381306 RepID=A0A1G5ED30_9GAMM|nr:glutamate-ammonia-ligase adenylyltransferase [Thiohalorhabdus denitrificans]
MGAMTASDPSPTDRNALAAAGCLRLSEIIGGSSGARLAEALLDDLGLRKAWLRVLASSAFVHRELRRYPALVHDLTTNPHWLREDWTPEDVRACIQEAVSGCTERAEFLASLRRARNWLMVRIAFRDLAGWVDFPRTARESTALAEAAVEAVLGFAGGELRPRFGTPRTPDGGPATLTVLGMGKLGGGELNFSSDIDLIFAYTADGETDGPRALDNGTYFTRLGRAVIQLLSEHTADGFAFRVDMRLRPHGDGGPLAQPLDGMEEYYQVHGREWERYALVKARPIAGDLEQGERLLAELQPFIFRRYLDFGAVEAVRSLKTQIQRQVESRRYRDDLKLGRGGIREIEFIVQAFQLLHGGRHRELRGRGTLATMAALRELELLPAWDLDDLVAAYLFLRRLENHLQMAGDEQTHRLPEEPEALETLARSLDFPDTGAFFDALDSHRDRVQEAFEQTFAAPQTVHEEEEPPLERVWQGQAEGEEARDILADHGYLHPGDALATLEQLRGATFLQRLTRTGRERLDRLMPLLIGAAGKTPAPAVALSRMAEVLEAIGGRSTYFALLAENPVALAQVVRLCGGSPFLARFLGRHPMLLDEVLDPEDLYACRLRASRATALERELEDADDLEDRLNGLRRFKSIEVLHLAARDLQGLAELDEVSLGLTEVAELTLERALTMAWNELTERYGRPMCTDGGERREAGFLVAGLGKLGGAELGYGSDLDLLFLHDSRGEDQTTEGGRRGGMDNGRFFARLGQRLIHFVTTLTAEGALYSIDMRLRPGGKSGALAASIDHFREYQLEQAWVWEHQALLRGRTVAGSPGLGATFQELRREILARPRGEEALAEAVRDMRGRMLAEHASPAGVFNIKRDRGGLIDIEFLIQYLCLRHAHRTPAILATSNRAALSALAGHGLIEPDTARDLDEAYVLFRTLENRVKLFEDRAQVEVTADPTWREQLDRMVDPAWRPVVPRLEATRDRVSAAFEAILGPPVRTG